MDSVFPKEGHVVPQYGSFTMENTGAYGGWVASAGDLITVLDSLVMDCEHSGHVLNGDSIKLMLERPGYDMNHIVRKLDLGVSHMVIHLPSCTAIEDSLRVEISD